MSTYRISKNFNGTKFNLALITGEGHEIDFGDYSYNSDAEARAAAESDSQERADEPAKFLPNTPITAAERTALETCLNYTDRAGQLSDNYSNGGPAEFAAALDWNKQQVGGLITSLENKGLAISDEEDSRMVWITEEGVNAIFDILELEEERDALVAELPGNTQRHDPRVHRLQEIITALSGVEVSEDAIAKSINESLYEKRVRELEAEGCSRSDAQAVADAEQL
jgi:hypothetical protein